jgi:thioredoxin reductase
MSNRPAFSHHGASPVRVLIAGGGVAALETLLALRDLAGERVSTTLLAPQPTFTSNAMSVARLFARGARSVSIWPKPPTRSSATAWPRSRRMPGAFAG